MQKRTSPSRPAESAKRLSDVSPVDRAKHLLAPGTALPHSKPGFTLRHNSHRKLTSHSCDPFREAPRPETLGKTKDQLAQRLQMYLFRSYSSNLLAVTPKSGAELKRGLRLPTLHSQFVSSALTEEELKTRDVPRSALPTIAERVKSKTAKKLLNAHPEPDTAEGALPRTGLFVPMEKPCAVAAFLPVPDSTREAIGSPVSHLRLQEIQKRESERLLAAEYGKATSGRLVFDSYETSPSQPGYGYEDLAFYNSECFPIDATPAMYNQVCAGRGAPGKFYPGKARYPAALKPFYRLQSSADTTLVFESRFESGNLRRAVQVYHAAK